jgi:hypothetical protein
MAIAVRPARPGDGAALSRVWLSTAAYYADLDPEHFQVPHAEGLAENWDNGFARHDDDSLRGQPGIGAFLRRAHGLPAPLDRVPESALTI